jgi:hypothetical protein
MHIEYAAQAVVEVDEALAYYRAIDPALSTFTHTHRRPQYWRDRLIKP